MRGIKIILPLIAAFVLAIAFSTFQVNSTEAHNSHVEYTVEPQPGVNVVQHGRSGLIEVEVTHCLIAGEPFAFTMLISSSRGGHSDLSVRKNSSVDISSWFTLNPGKVGLPSDGTEVTVGITPPVGAELDQWAVVRIQEIGDPPAPGGHHGVKVRVSCVKQPTSTPTPSPAPAPTPPTALVPPVSRPPTAFPELTPTPSPEASPTPPPTLIPPVFATPTPEIPSGFPPTGGEPPKEESDSPWIYLIIDGAALATTGGFLTWRKRSWFSQ